MDDITFEILTEIINFQVDMSGATRFLELVDTPNNYEDGKYLKSTSNGLVFDVPAGGGDMLKASYDTNDDGIVDHAEIANQIDGGSFT